MLRPLTAFVSAMDGVSITGTGGGGESPDMVAGNERIDGMKSAAKDEMDDQVQ